MLFRSVRASFIDHAGHVETVEKFYQIDATPPVITVEYDRNTPAHEKYYDQARTAYVTIRERNFDPRDVVFTITNTEGALPEIGSFRSTGQGDDMQHSCQVVFQEDGEYTFTVGFQDLAGNVADYSRVDTFVIDRTDPVLTVTYDNQEAASGFYFAKGRRATLTVEIGRAHV